MALPQEVTIDWYAMEEPWTLQRNNYTAQPQGSPLEMSIRVMEFLSGTKER